MRSNMAWPTHVDFRVYNRVSENDRERMRDNQDTHWSSRLKASAESCSVHRSFDLTRMSQVSHRGELTE
jgi:hypothetical protein